MVIVIGLTSLVILYNSLSPKVEFGTLPDWIAAFGSIATLVIAWLAFRAAPSWLRQKMDETALIEADKLINIHYYQLKNNLSQLLVTFRHSKSIVSDLSSNPQKTNDAIDLKNKFDELIKQNDVILEEIMKSEELLRQKGWFLKPKYSFLDAFGIEKISINISFVNYATHFSFLTNNDGFFKLGSTSIDELKKSLNDFNDASKNFTKKFEAMRKATIGILAHKNPILTIFKRY